jgi:hypothetical protein
MKSLVYYAVLCAFLTVITFAQGVEFVNGPKLTSTRMAAASVKLPDGRVAVFGGHASGFVKSNTADIYNPLTNTFSQLTMQDYRDAAAIAVLPNGKIFLAGGMSDNSGVGQLSTTEIYDPATNTFAAGPGMGYARTMPQAATLADGKVLIVGCWYSSTAAAVAEVYDPSLNTITATGSVIQGRAYPVVLPLSDGNALVFGGSDSYGGSTYPEAVEKFDASTKTFSQVRASLFEDVAGYVPRNDYFLTDTKLITLQDGRYIYLASKDTAGITKFRLFTVNPSNGAFEILSSLPDYNPAMGDSVSFLRPIVVGQNNMIYMFSSKATTSGRKYVVCSVNTLNGALTIGKEENTPDYYYNQASISLIDEKTMIVIGGYVSSNFDAVDSSLIVKLPVPVSDNTSFINGPKMNGTKMAAASVKLADGRFAVFGGHAYGFARSNTAEIYDPVTNKFTQLTMQDYRDFTAIATLQNGKIFIAGGMSSDLGVGQLSSTEIFDPASNTFTAGSAMNYVRAMAQAATLTSGKVLIAGCWYSSESASVAEVFDPSLNTFTATGSVIQGRAYPVIVPLNDGGALVFGGTDPYGSSTYPEAVEQYSASTNSFTQVRASLFADVAGYVPRNTYYLTDPNMIRLSDGRYVYLASKDTAGITKFRLFTVNPATAAIEVFNTSLALPDYNPAAGDSISFNRPIVDASTGIIYMLSGKASSVRKYVLCALKASKGKLIIDKAENTPDYYYDQGSMTLFAGGKIFVAGGYVSSNFDAVDSTVFISVGTTDIKDSYTHVNSFSLAQNYPNPFNPSTTIKFRLTQSGVVNLAVYDIMGREISTLVNEFRAAGEHEVRFNASQLSSGVYLYRLRMGNQSLAKKMLILK